MSYRPVTLKGWTKATPQELVGAVQDYLYRFTKTRAYDSGVRLANTEAYLQGLLDMKRLSQPTATSRKSKVTSKKATK